MRLTATYDATCVLALEASPDRRHEGVFGAGTAGGSPPVGDTSMLGSMQKCVEFCLLVFLGIVKDSRLQVCVCVCARVCV